MSTSDALLLAGLVLAGVLAIVLATLFMQKLMQRKRQLLFHAPTQPQLSTTELDPVISSDVQARQAKWQTLSERQKQACRLAAQGLKDTEMAMEMDVTVRTVRSHLSTSYGKLGIGSRYELKYFVRDLVD